ncbi:FkbM family methyltransferase [Defluviimonas sp. WL0075]|uniref:FkbM family methyltransferase n=1 Tax=Albidovulum sediminicola TaxID=2984331 RepID=A0ABT2Z173_9RHOB|nr:FkbM family methyltransferase [Defluviimonas sp. WL0075]MCV2864775.1 FkbM family methyltransferase [Defluviimonas sp. WL0075]
MSERNPKDAPKTLDDLWAINKAVADRLDELIHLQRIALLGQDRIFSFPHEDEMIHLNLPFAERDYIQRNIIKAGGFYETRQLELLRATGLVKPGAVICDVGANIGNHSVYFAKTFQPSRLVAIEPQQQALNILRKNLALNGIDAATVVNCLLGSAEGHGNVAGFIRANLGGTSFREEEGGRIPMRTLDSILAEETGGKVDFVKIDVEGMHVEVLSGAKRMLSEARPHIWIELRVFRNEYDSGAAIFAKHGYRQAHKLGQHDFIFSPST